MKYYLQFWKSKWNYTRIMFAFLLEAPIVHIVYPYKTNFRVPGRFIRISEVITTENPFTESATERTTERSTNSTATPTAVTPDDPCAESVTVSHSSHSIFNGEYQYWKQINGNSAYRIDFGVYNQKHFWHVLKWIRKQNFTGYVLGNSFGGKFFKTFQSVITSTQRPICPYNTNIEWNEVRQNAIVKGMRITKN